MTDEAKALVEECRLDTKAFRENTVYDSDGDPIRLIANADRLDQYADLIETQAREIERLREALQFYARKYNWKSCGVYMCGHSNPSSAEIDRGNKARAALAGDSHE